MTGNYVKANGIAPDRQKVSFLHAYLMASQWVFLVLGQLEKKSTKCYQGLIWISQLYHIRETILPI